jgi:sugar phosphate isomerase/epimerase
MSTSRRQFAKGMLASFPVSLAVAKAERSAEAVRIGVCTYSFRDVPRQNGDAIGPTLQALRACQANICELFSPQLEPAEPSGHASGSSHDQLREWRLSTPMEYFKQVRAKFESAGVEIYAYTLNFNEHYTDEELDRCFQQAKALNAKTIASSTQVSLLPRLKPLAEKHRITVAVHGHSDTKHPDEFSSPDTFQKALDLSDWFRVNLDIGHFSAAGFDPVAYIKEHHDRITHLHVKDRKKNDGPNEPFGQGDTPIAAVLRLLKDNRYPIPALVEYEYHGTGTPVEEVNKCLAYMRHALQG